MKAKRCWIYVAMVMLVFLSVFAGVMTFAQVADKAEIQQEFRRRLSDSNGVSVHVSVITKEKSEEESLTTQLQEDVERELENSDIKILTKEELEYTPGRPRLGVYLVMYKGRCPSKRPRQICSFLPEMHPRNASPEKSTYIHL